MADRLRDVHTQTANRIASRVPQTASEKDFLASASPKAVAAFQRVDASSACALCGKTAGVFTSLRHCGGCGRICCSTMAVGGCLTSSARYEVAPSASVPECSSCKEERFAHFGGLQTGDSVANFASLLSADQRQGPLPGGYRVGDEVVAIELITDTQGADRVKTGELGVVLGPVPGQADRIQCRFPTWAAVNLTQDLIEHRSPEVPRGTFGMVLAHCERGVLECSFGRTVVRVHLSNLFIGKQYPGRVKRGQQVEAITDITSNGKPAAKKGEAGTVVGPCQGDSMRVAVVFPATGRCVTVPIGHKHGFAVAWSDLPEGFTRGHLARFSQEIKTTTGKRYAAGSIVQIVCSSKRTAGYIEVRVLRDGKPLSTDPAKFLRKCYQLPDGYSFGARQRHALTPPTPNLPVL